MGAVLWLWVVHPDNWWIPTGAEGRGPEPRRPGKGSDGLARMGPDKEKGSNPIRTSKAAAVLRGQPARLHSSEFQDQPSKQKSEGCVSINTTSIVDSTYQRLPTARALFVLFPFFPFPKQSRHNQQHAGKHFSKELKGGCRNPPFVGKRHPTSQGNLMNSER